MSVKNIRRIPPATVQVCRAYTETGELCNQVATRIHPVSGYSVCVAHWSPPEVFFNRKPAFDMMDMETESNQSQSARLQVASTVFIGQSRMF